MRRIFALVLALPLMAAAPSVDGVPPGPVPPAANQKLAHDILRDLVAVRSVHPIGTVQAAQVMRDYLVKGGFAPSDITMLADPKYPHQMNVVVRLKGKGQGKPVLWIGHLDVVDARPQDWSLPPFKLSEKDGWFYGRGTTDMKDGDAAMAASLIRLKQEGFVPDRDIIVAFTADEEVGLEQDGPAWLLKTHRPLVDAGMVVNTDGSSGEIADAKRRDFGVETSQKVYVTFHLDVFNKGGHSSEPRPDNAIYTLARGLARLEAYSFPITLNATTRAYFRAMAGLESGQRRADMLAVAADRPDPAAAARLARDTALNALLHTTCVATMLDAGVQENALPAHAQATVQCRIMPSERAEQTRATLEKVLDDPAIKVSLQGFVTYSPESPPTPAVMGKVEKVARSMWPGVPVMPVMAAGASDSIFTRNAGIPSYGVGGAWGDVKDIRAHGRDERISAANFYSEVEFTYRLMKELSD